MEPRGYRGAWASTAQIDRALLPSPGVDSTHLHPDLPDEGSRPPSGAPPRMATPPLFLTEYEDDSYRLAVDTPGVIFDLETQEHDPGDPDVPVPPSPAHLIDRGKVADLTDTPINTRASDERYETTRVEHAPILGDLTVAALRGENSLPQNNPDGYRYGWLVWRRMDRTAFPSRGMWRVHTERLLRAGGAASEIQSPALKVGNRWTSPFSWNKKLVESRLQFPMLRRDPPAWSESMTSDGSDQPPNPAFADWVIG